MNINLPSFDYWPKFKECIDEQKCDLKIGITYSNGKFVCSILINDIDIDKKFGFAGNMVDPYNIMSETFKSACIFLHKIGKNDFFGNAANVKADELNRPMIEYIPKHFDIDQQNDFDEIDEDELLGSYCGSDMSYMLPYYDFDECEILSQEESSGPSSDSGTSYEKFDKSTSSFHVTDRDLLEKKIDFAIRQHLERLNVGKNYIGKVVKQMEISNDSDFSSTEPSNSSNGEDASEIIYRADIVYHKINFDENLKLNYQRETFEKNKIVEDNVGFQLIQTFGWKGGPLGIRKQGIVEPIGIGMIKTNRKGIGASVIPNLSKKERNIIFDRNMDFKREILNHFLSDYAADEKQSKILIFSLEFTFREKIILKELANNLDLEINYKHNYLTVSKPFILTSKKLPSNLIKIKDEEESVSLLSEDNSKCTTCSDDTDSVSIGEWKSDADNDSIIRRIHVARRENIFQSRKLDGKIKIVYYSENDFGRVKLKRFLRFYAEDTKMMNEMKFTSEFSPLERKIMTEISQEFGLNATNVTSDNLRDVLLIISKPINYSYNKFSKLSKKGNSKLVKSSKLDENATNDKSKPIAGENLKVDKESSENIKSFNIRRHDIFKEMPVKCNLGNIEVFQKMLDGQLNFSNKSLNHFLVNYVNDAKCTNQLVFKKEHFHSNEMNDLIEWSKKFKLKHEICNGVGLKIQKLM